MPKLIIGKIKSRIFKDKQEQVNRTKKSAEVFTPSWICNEMNNSCDEEWFGYKNVFNIPHGHEWISKSEPIHFTNDGDWQKYVDSRRLEITCGEAPFLTSRYDVVSGDVLQVEKRIGILDRKLRVVNENTNDETEWFKWAKRAFESTYGYEYQGDSLFLARENLLFTFIENYAFKFDKEPELAQVKQIANIIAWNVWQMDGLNDCVPFSYEEKQEGQLDLFGDLPKILLPVPCKIRNWRSDKVYYFKELRGGKKMKFGVVIGNPPYQEDDGGNGASAKPLYHLLIEQAKKIKPKFITMITPSKWFSGGKGLDKFRNSMLKDTRIRVIHDFVNAKECFSVTKCEGGVNYFLWDRDYNGMCEINTHINGKIVSTMKRSLLEKGSDVFIRYNEAISILHKVQKLNEDTMNNMVSSRKPFGLESNFKDFKLEPFENSTKLYYNGWRKTGIGYIDKNLIKASKNLIDKIKVLVSKAYGAGNEEIKQILNKPIIAEKNSCCTETYLIINSFDEIKQAESLKKYIETKFFRFLVCLIKNTQNATKKVYSFVPNQNWDEEWTDEKLYKKYNLNQDEINFIETRIKEMK